MKFIFLLAAGFFALVPLDGAVAASKLSQVFTSDMLGAQTAYLEHLVGPAMRVIPIKKSEYRSYKVDGCNVEARITSVAGGPPSVDALSLDLSPRCKIDLKDFHLEPLSTRGLTISKLADWKSLGFESSCISLCGNAADPTVDFIQKSSHATNWIGVVYTITIADEPALKATEDLSEVMQAREGEDYVIDTKFNCDAKYTDLALKLFANVPVNRITVGIFPDDPDERCK